MASLHAGVLGAIGAASPEDLAALHERDGPSRMTSLPVLAFGQRPEARLGPASGEAGRTFHFEFALDDVPPVWLSVAVSNRFMAHLDLWGDDMDWTPSPRGAVDADATLADPSHRTTCGCCRTRRVTRAGCRSEMSTRTSALTWTLAQGP